MNILFIGGSSEIALKISKKIKYNIYSISRKNNIGYYKKNIKIKSYNEKNIDLALKKMKHTKFKSIFFFNGYHKASLLSFFNEDLFNKILETNLKIPIKITSILLTKQCIEKNGSINFVGSIAAKKNEVGNAYYSIAKLALASASKLFMKEQKKRGVRFNTFSIGLVKTRMALNLISKMPYNSIKKIKFTTIKKIANKFIAVAKSENTNGKNIFI
tara:strand:+ start:219 stop:863 length:645 start_codon:yes stop_codon:yes gene_type:complete